MNNNYRNTIIKKNINNVNCCNWIEILKLDKNHTTVIFKGDILMFFIARSL